MTSVIYYTLPYSVPFDLANKPFIVLPLGFIESFVDVLEFRL